MNMSKIKSDVAIIIPSIPAREKMLKRALASIEAQEGFAPADVLVMLDEEREGSATMRNLALEKISEPWIMFLDDDDEFLPNHFKVLLAARDKHPDVDVFYSGCRVYGKDGREIPRRMEWGRYLQPFDADLLRQKSYIPVTSMVRTDLAKQARFEAPEGTYYDDWGFYLGMLNLGAKFLHVPKVTWTWHHHGKHSQGRGDVLDVV